MTSETANGARGNDERTSADAVEAPLVSVIVRSIGRDTLSEALDSVAAQDYPNIEVIVVNAKGADHPRIPGSCGRFPVRVVGGAEPLPRSRAANVGLDAARGAYIGFLDDDDWFDPVHVEGLVAALESDSGFELAYSGAVGVGADSAAVAVFNRAFDPVELRLGNFLTLHSALFRRVLVDEDCSFDESFEVYEDWDFFLQVAGRGPFLHVDKVTARYRAGGLSGAGLSADEPKRRAGRQQLFDKWRHTWSGEQINQMVERLALRSVQAEQRARERESELVDVYQSQLAFLESQLHGILHSVSWRATALFRGVSFAVRGRPRRGEASAGTDRSARVSATGEIAEGSPLVTAIMPVFNACRTDPRFLHDAIQSVVRQTYRNVELLIVDDGSTDGTSSECERYLEGGTPIPVRYVRKENGGQSSARNLGIQLAHGTWIGFLDQDDMWYPDKLERVVRHFGREIVAVYTDADTIGPDNEKLLIGIHRHHHCGYPHPKRSIDDVLCKDIFVMPGLMTIRKQALQDIGGFDESLSGYEDDDLFLRLYELGRIKYLPESTLLWRMHSENYSFSSRMIRSRLRYWQKLMDRYADGHRGSTRERIISRRFFQEFIRQAVFQRRDGVEMWRDNLSTAAQLRPHLSLREQLMFGFPMSWWVWAGARWKSVERFMQLMFRSQLLPRH